MKIILNRYYDKSKCTDDIIGDFGFISFTKEFTYLGSIVSYDLDDYADVTSRIKKASQAMGALKIFWDSNHVDIGAKVLIYLAIPVNLLLWGCQSWALTKVLIKKLEVFHMRCIRRILQIKWDDVREFKIKNSQVRERFKNIDTIENIISKRRLIFIGKVIRMPCKCVPARLISAFQTNKRPLSRPNITVRHSFINDIEK